MTIIAMKQALDALEVCEQSDYGRKWVWPDTAHPTAMGNVREAITTLRQAIAEAEQEPVAWGMQHDDGSIYDCITPEEHARLEGEYKTPLYTHPQPKQEPVAWMYQSKADSTPCFMQDKKDWAESGSGIWTETPLYTHPQPTEERNFCPRCGKRTADLTVIHTCMPPKDTYTRPQPLTDEQIEEIAKQARSKAHAVTLTIKSLKKNT